MEGLGTEADRVESAETTLKIHDEYSDVFMYWVLERSR